MTEVHYYGELAEIAGSATERFKATRSDALLNEIHARHPALASRRFALAVGHRIVVEPVDLPPDETVSLLPPFSGG